MGVWFASIFAAAVTTAAPANGDIPPTLEPVVDCMVAKARATPGVLAADYGVSGENVFVRYTYRADTIPGAGLGAVISAWIRSCCVKNK